MDISTAYAIAGISAMFIGGGYAFIQIVLAVGRWTSTVSRAMTDNTNSNKELSRRMDTISKQLDRYDREIEANRRRLDYLEKTRLEHGWDRRNRPPS